jgi:hypothetical protein
VGIRLFEVIETIGQVLVVNFSNLLDSFHLKKKIIAFVQNEGANLNALISIAKSIFNCNILKLEESFNGNYFKHVFSKACQYGIAKEKVYKDMGFMSIKNA